MDMDMDMALEFPRIDSVKSICDEMKVIESLCFIFVFSRIWSADILVVTPKNKSIVK